MRVHVINVVLRFFIALGYVASELTFQHFSGIWLHTSGCLGASPDGIVQGAATCNHMTPELLEVKCPWKARDFTIQEAVIQFNDFCLGKDNNTMTCHRLIR